MSYYFQASWNGIDLARSDRSVRAGGGHTIDLEVR